MTPEQQARWEIDRQLLQCGWVVKNYREMNISAGLGVAVREFPLKGGHSDYMLYVTTNEPLRLFSRPFVRRLRLPALGHRFSGHAHRPPSAVRLARVSWT